MKLECYLDNAATSHPKPKCVSDAVRAALNEWNANPGRSGHSRALTAAEHVLRTRERLAEFLNVSDAFRVVFCLNCTDALNLAIKGIVRPGDHVICSALEHNSVLRVLERLKLSGTVDYTVVSPSADGMVDPARYATAIRANTRLLILTHASNVTGVVQPVEAVGRVARANGLYYLVDGAQALGCLPVDMNAIMCDLYAFPGHKSLLGPQGTGGLYIAPGIRLATLREGGTGSSSDRLLQPEELPERYEAGTLNLPGICGLDAGVGYVSAHLQEIQDTESRLSRTLIRELKKMNGVVVYTPEQGILRTGTVALNVGDLSSGEVADRLNKRGILVRAGLHCAPLAHRYLGTFTRGCVRVSFGHASTDDDLHILMSALSEIADGNV